MLQDGAGRCRVVKCSAACCSAVQCIEVTRIDGAGIDGAIENAEVFLPPTLAPHWCVCVSKWLLLSLVAAGVWVIRGGEGRCARGCGG